MTGGIIGGEIPPANVGGRAGVARGPERAGVEESRAHSAPRALYIHVPFCSRRCSYCDFAVQATRVAPTREWLDAVETEARLLAAERGWTEPLELDTVYVGGGTPSLLGPGAMAALAERLRPFATWNPSTVEWTCEANPESFTPELAADWRAAGVNRISLGAQSFHPPALRWMGRLHGPEGPARAMLAARSAGFDNVSVDLIFGLPERLGRDWGGDLERALELEPEHVSLYGLTAEAGAPLGRWVREGRESLAEEDRYADEYLLAHERLTAAGFVHYEVSNFGLPGRASRHNLVYWTGAPYAALGPGAHAFYNPLRRWNLRDWRAYREALLEGRLPTEDEERVDADEAALERAWLLLRTKAGFPLPDATAAQRTLAAEWVRRGWARIDRETLRLGAEGWLLLDRLAVELASAGEK
ncbi:MAG TPA: radical SAM family heme chaperone HemW [Longimicrobiaceae bacterium]|nr:radical SAM family heme chaperone HemW [Longimicrobiaceae bacterium]